jgi:hypothetical protein
MKKVICILLFLAFGKALLNAQTRFRPGVKLGLSTTQVHGDTYAGFHKTGPAGGLLLNAKLSEKWYGQFEMLYIQKGSRHNANPEAGDYVFYLMKLNYIEVPVLFQYKLKKFVFELGPGFGYLINAREFDYYGEISNAPPFRKYEISASVGINYVFLKRLTINWRYTNSLLPIRTFSNSSVATVYNPGQRSNVMAFTLNYIFGETDAE